MAYPTAVNDAKSRKVITTPVSEDEIKAAFERVQSRASAGQITGQVVGAFVQYVALNMADYSDIGKTADAIVSQTMGYLQGYDGANKQCIVNLIDGGSYFVESDNVANEAFCGWTAGCFGGANSKYGISCIVTWE